MTEILNVSSVSRRFGGLLALQNVSLKLSKGEILGLIGPNGAGKTTLINVITGVNRPSSGTITFEGRDISRIKPFQAARSGLARTFQIVQPFPSMTVMQNVAAAALFSRPGMNLTSAEKLANEQLEFVGLGRLVDQSASSLTLAMRKRLEMAKALAMCPRILFLDEVNAGLNNTEVGHAVALIRRLAANGMTIILIEHLMKVVANVCSRIAVLQNGSLIADGSPTQVMNDPSVVAAYLGKKYAQRYAGGRGTNA